MRTLGLLLCAGWFASRLVELLQLVGEGGWSPAPIQTISAMPVVAHYAFVGLCVLCAISALKQRAGSHNAWIALIGSLLVVFPLELSTTGALIDVYFATSAVSLVGTILSAWLLYRHRS
jgi:hypothetical protein